MDNISFRRATARRGNVNEDNFAFFAAKRNKAIGKAA
jgi:hypothetical protein